MAFQKGHEKVGGRQKGPGLTLQQKLLATQERIQKKHPGFDPLELLAQLAIDNMHPILGDPGIAKDCLKEIAKYTYPQLKSIELSEDPDNPIGSALSALVKFYIPGNGRDKTAEQPQVAGNHE